jgi:hypothetical protein
MRAAWYDSYDDGEFSELLTGISQFHVTYPLGNTLRQRVLRSNRLSTSDV